MRWRRRRTAWFHLTRLQLHRLLHERETAGLPPEPIRLVQHLRNIGMSGIRIRLLVHLLYRVLYLELSEAVDR